jgi:hypothetical protein
MGNSITQPVLDYYIRKLNNGYKLDKKEYTPIVAALKDRMATRRRIASATYKDLITLLKCKQAGNFEPMYNTKLYNKYSGEYCEYLLLLLD